MRVRVAPEAELVRLGEVSLVAVGRAFPHHNLLPRLDRPSAELTRHGRSAPFRWRGGRPAQDLLDGLCHGYVTRPQQAELFGPVDEREHGPGDGIARRLRARGEQQREEGRELVVAQPRRDLVGQLGVDDSGEHVGPRLGAFLLDQRTAVLVHPVERGLTPGRYREDVRLVWHVEYVLYRLEEEVAVRLGDAQQQTDGLHRELGGHVGQEVEFVAGRIEEHPHPTAQLSLEAPHRRRRQALGHEPPDPRVARVVHHVQHHARHGQILDRRPAVGTTAAGLRGEGHGVVEHPEHVVVAGDRPEPLAVGRVHGGLVPPDRRHLTMQAEHAVREPVGEGVEVGQVHPPEVIGHADILMGVPFRVKNGSAGV
jgi:hypothetical protein